VEDIDFRSPRGLDRTLVRSVTQNSAWVREHQNMILTSQLPVAKWHEQIGDPTLADSILDRLVHNAHRIEMRGESMRKKRGGKEV